MAKENHIQQSISNVFPPVVTVLGHVDHGKTTLLDAIRKSSIAQRESGGITQKIGASSVATDYDSQKRLITFIDTPGHEAFTTMRQRGTRAADIAILVVSATDGVMPQTRESIKLLQDAKLPFIVAFTKADLDGKIIEKAKQQLLKEGVLLEGLGGDIPYIEVSAKTGLHVQDLLHLVLLSFDLQPHTALSSTSDLSAIVIESSLDPKIGSRATVVVKNGTLQVRDEVVCEEQVFRVRSLVNPDGEHVESVSIGEAAELFGMDQVVGVGSLITGKANREALIMPGEKQDQPAYAPMKDVSKLRLVICADTEGSLEAIQYALPDGIDIINKKTGETSEADILMAKSTGAIVVSFNSRIRPQVQKLAQTEKVLAKNYTVIYEMIGEITDVLEGRRQALVEEIFGTARIQAKFPFEKSFAAGITIMDGRVARGDRVRIMRGNTSVGESVISSLRVGKNPQTKVEKGHEAGVVLSTPIDFSEGDMILSHS